MPLPYPTQSDYWIYLTVNVDCWYATFDIHLSLPVTTMHMGTNLEEDMAWQIVGHVPMLCLNLAIKFGVSICRCGQVTLFWAWESLRRDAEQMR